MDTNAATVIIVGIIAAYFAFKTWVNRNNQQDCDRFHEDDE